MPSQSIHGAPNVRKISNFQRLEMLQCLTGLQFMYLEPCDSSITNTTVGQYLTGNILAYPHSSQFTYSFLRMTFPIPPYGYDSIVLDTTVKCIHNSSVLGTIVNK